MKRMAWWTLAAGLPVFLQAAPLLTGETSNPANSCFAHGSAARAVFKASGFTAGTRPVLCVQVFDEADAYRATLVSNAVAVAADGTWSGDVALPTDRYGFFRVRATLGGVTWPKTGSRPAGCLTYHVAPDPSTRPLYGENDHFLGIHGVPCEAAYYLQWVGARWGLRGIGPFDTTNAREVREVFNAANAKHPGRVRLVMNGHHHVDHVRILDDLVYWDVNSANHYWWGGVQTKYPKDYVEKHRLTPRTLAWKDPLSAVLTLYPDGRISVKGAASDWLFGVTPRMAGFSEYDGSDRLIAPRIRSFDVTLNACSG